MTMIIGIIIAWTATHMGNLQKK